MPILNYSISGNEARVDANAAINDIQHNKTLLVSQFTYDDIIK